MKIRRIEIAISPAAGAMPYDDYKVFTISVRTECGRILDTQQGFYESDFQDAFGWIMKNAERQIRRML